MYYRCRYEAYIQSVDPKLIQYRSEGNIRGVDLKAMYMVRIRR